MAEASMHAPPRARNAALWGGGAVSVALLLAGLLGALGEAWGYALLLVSGLLLAAAAAVFGVFLLSSRFEGATLRHLFTQLFAWGLAFYVFGVCALAGYYTYETLQGRMELRWIIFGPAILAALVILDLGIYRRLVEKNLPTYRRYGRFISREQSDPAAMRRTLLDEVVLHRSLFSVSRFRWLRHTLIYWGFMLLFATELLAVVFREALPAFGWPALWMPGHTLRLAFDFSFEVFGAMVLVGCILALVWRVMVNGTPEQKYADTPTAIFLLAVVLSGFLVEALRFAAFPEPLMAVSFLGYGMAALLPAGTGLYEAAYEPLWYLHVIGSCVFIAYVPIKRLVHSCATPMGRLMNSQKRLLEEKRRGVLGGLFPGKPS